MTADAELVARVLPTPFYSSFIGRAVAGDTSDPDPGRRAAAWAHWAVVGLADMRGLSDRQYVALTLAGKFYDPRGTGPAVPPHLEIPSRRLEQADPEFPDRLAQMGNALNYPLWVMPEVTAVRRALFTTGRPGGDAPELGPLLTLLADHRLALIESVTALGEQAREHWSDIERTLAAEPGELVDAACGDFSTSDVASFFPAAAHVKLSATFDSKLRDTSKQWAARRVGVWTLQASINGEVVRLGVLTPRLTANSMFRDPAFLPARESAAALLLRGLLLRRLLKNHLGLSNAESVASAAPPQPSGGPHLRAIVAKYGQKLPEASPGAAALFLQTYPHADTAWTELTGWCTKHGYIPTVTRDTFERAHAEALHSLQRAEDSDRAAVDTLLPLAWDKEARVVRLTFVRARRG